MKIVIKQTLVIISFCALFLSACGGGGDEGGGDPTITPSDTTAPAAVTNLQQEQSSLSSVMLSWTNPADEDFDRVEISFVPGGSTPLEVDAPAESREITGLSFGEQYVFTVTAVDDSGNRSAGTDISVLLTNKGVPEWANSLVTAPSDVAIKGSATGPDGSVYLAGYIIGTSEYDFGDGVKVSGTNFGNNILLVKYDSDGTAQWAKSVVSGPANSSFLGVTAGSDGSVIAAGIIESTDEFNFGNEVKVSAAYTDDNLVLVKYDSGGEAQWAKSTQAGTSVETHFFAVAQANDGSIYAAGALYWTTTLNLGNGVSVNSPGDNAHTLLVKYDSSGTPQWAKTAVVSSSWARFYSVSVASDGSVFTGGCRQGTDTIDYGDDVTVNGITDMYEYTLLVKYDSSGNPQWAKSTESGAGSSAIESITSDSSGNVYAAGTISNASAYSFGNSVSVAGISDNGNFLLIKYDGDGQAQWARSAIEGGYSELFSVAAGTDGYIYAAGTMERDIDFDFGNEVGLSGSDDDGSSLIIKYDDNGNAQWARSNKGDNWLELYAISISQSGLVYIAGYLEEGAYDLGSGVTGSGKQMIVAQYQ